MDVQFFAVLPGLILWGLCFYFCIRTGRRKGFHLILCILAGFYNLPGLLIILLIPARKERQQRRDSRGFSPPSGQPASVREIEPVSPSRYPGEPTDGSGH